MGMFYEILSSINNPNQQGSVEQLASVVNSVQTLSQSSGIDPATMQTVLSSVGGVLRPALQQPGGLGGLGNLVGQLAGGNTAGGLSGLSNLSNLMSMVPPQLQQQIVQVVAEKTGMDANAIAPMLPGILNAVMGFLNMGASAPGATGSNPVLSAFLDGNNDGMDLGDVLNFAGRFLNPA